MKLSLLLSFVIWMLCLNDSKSQNSRLLNPYFLCYNSGKPIEKKFPIEGQFWPVSISNYKNHTRSGLTDYILFQVDNYLEVGKQYKISMKINMPKAFGVDEYFTTHFGIACLQSLPSLNWGIIRAQYSSLPLSTTIDSSQNILFSFRSLCKTKYIAIGVFTRKNGPTNLCDFCFYSFWIDHFEIAEDLNKTNDLFTYLCDYFESSTDSIHADKNKLSIFYNINQHTLDDTSFVKIEKFTKDRRKAGFILNSYTDLSGSNNQYLSEQRSKSVKSALVSIGVDSNNIFVTNNAEKYSADKYNALDRRVDIQIDFSLPSKLLLGELRTKGEKLSRGEFEYKIEKWLVSTPPDHHIYLLFDCNFWEYVPIAYKKIYKNKIIKNTYKSIHLSFQLDSLWCEDQKFRVLERAILSNLYSHTKLLNSNCLVDTNNISIINQIENEKKIESLIKKHSLKNIIALGERKREAFLYIIIHSDNIQLQKKYLQIIKEFCDLSKIEWKYYAILYDKISLKEQGVQRYGTQSKYEDKKFEYLPFENIEMLNEYRKQVKLAPIFDY